MKVLHLSSYLPGLHPFWGGAERACQRIIELLEDGGDVQSATVTTPVNGDGEPPCRHFSIETVPDRFHAPYWPFLRHYWLQKDPIVFRQLSDILQKWRPDLIHFHNFNVMTFAALHAARRLNIPRVISIYDYWLFCPTDMLVDRDVNICQQGHGFHCLYRCLPRHFFRRWHHYANLPVFTRKTYFQRQLRSFNRVITLSDNSREVMQRYSPDPLEIDVIPLPAHVEQPKVLSRKKQNRPTIMYAGWVQARKGPDVLVKAMAEVIKKISDAHLVIVGALSESHFESYLRNLITDLHLDNHVTITGKLPQEQFDSHFQSADIIAVAEQWYNMSPVFLLEAMAAAKTIVAGAIGGIPEYIRNEKEALLATYNDPVDFAGQLVRALNDSKLAGKLGENAAKRVKHLCRPEETYQRLLSSYSEAISS